MLVGAKPDRPSANYKLNTLVSNRIRKATTGKTGWSQGSRTLHVGTLCSLSREATKAVGGMCALELDSVAPNPGPSVLCDPDLSESASPSGEWAQSLELSQSSSECG